MEKLTVHEGVKTYSLSLTQEELDIVMALASACDSIRISGVSAALIPHRKKRWIVNNGNAINLEYAMEIAPLTYAVPATPL